MFKSLNTGAIGINVSSLEQGIKLAARHGFEGYHFDIREAAGLGVSKLKEILERNSIRLASWNFPVEFRKDQAVYDNTMTKLPELAKTADSLDARRTSIWILPSSDDMSYKDYFTFHIKRLKPAASILADHNIRFGLEYIAPLSSRKAKKNIFIYNMEKMMELCQAIGTNVGLLIDSWHWYNAQETVDDLKALQAEQVVEVHINDAPDLPLEEQKDNVRGLPGDTGVIDIVGFLNALKDIGYDGPVSAEPFSEKVNNMDTDEAVAVTIKAINEVFSKAGV